MIGWPQPSGPSWKWGPVLACRVQDRFFHPQWIPVSGFDADSLLSVVPASAAGGEINRLLLEDIDPWSGPIVRFALVRGERDALVVNLDHTAGDAASVRSLAYLLATLYDQPDRVAAAGRGAYFARREFTALRPLMAESGAKQGGPVPPPAAAPLVGAAVSDHPGGQGTLSQNPGGRRRYRHQFPPGRLHRRGAVPAPGPGRGAQRRPGPGGRQRPPATWCLNKGLSRDDLAQAAVAAEPGRDPPTAPLLHGGPAHRDLGGHRGNPPTGAPFGALRHQGQPRQAPPGPHHPKSVVLCAQTLHSFPVGGLFRKWRS